MDPPGHTGVITGASGFIGRAVLRGLPAGVRVHAVYHSSVDFPEWTRTLAAEVVPVRLDLRRDRLSEAVPDTEWALLLAARVATADSLGDPLGELEAVAGVTANAIRGLRTGAVVHVSSGSVYERLVGDLSPDRRLRPKLPYSISKLAAELLLETYAQAPFWTLRFFGAYGPGEPSFKLARRLVEAFGQGDRAFTLQGDGRNRIDPMHIDDAVAMLIGFLGTPPENRVLDVSQGEAPSIAEFARLAYEVAHPDPAGGRLQLRFEGSPVESMLGASRPMQDSVLGALARRTLSDGLREYAARMV